MQTGFIERERKFDGASYAQTLVFGWLGNPAATLEELAQVARVVGVAITRQGLDERFSPQSAELMKAVLAETLRASVYWMWEPEPGRWREGLRGEAVR